MLQIFSDEPYAACIRTLLVKLAETFGEFLYRFACGLEPVSRNGISQKIKASCDSANESLFGMLPDLQLCHRLVDDSDRFSQLPASWGEDYPIVHEANVNQARRVHTPV